MDAVAIVSAGSSLPPSDCNREPAWGDAHDLLRERRLRTPFVKDVLPVAFRWVG